MGRHWHHALCRDGGYGNGSPSTTTAHLSVIDSAAVAPVDAGTVDRFGIRRLTTGTMSPLEAGYDQRRGDGRRNCQHALHRDGRGLALCPRRVKIVDWRHTHIAGGGVVGNDRHDYLPGCGGGDMVLKYRAMNQSLVAEKTRLRAILDTAVDGIIILNPGDHCCRKSGRRIHFWLVRYRFDGAERQYLDA